MWLVAMRTDLAVALLLWEEEEEVVLSLDSRHLMFKWEACIHLKWNKILTLVWSSGGLTVGSHSDLSFGFEG